MFLVLVSSSFALSAQTSTNALPPLAPAYPQMPPTFWEQHGVEVFIGGFVLLALAAIALWMIFKPKPEPVLPPEVVARQALARLHGHPEDGNVLSEVSQILRRYVGMVFQFPPAELTTAEFSNALASSENIGPELAQVISDFLRECDAQKFSPANAPTPLNATGRALNLVEQIEKRRAELRAQTPMSK